WVARPPEGADDPWVAAVAPGRAVAALAGPPGRVYLIDVKTGKFVLGYVPHDPALPNPAADPAAAARPGRTVRALAFGPDGTRLASGGADGTVRVWDAADPAALAGRYLKSGGPSDGVPPLAVLREHSAPVTAVAFGP